LPNSNFFPQEANAEALREPLNNDGAPTVLEQPDPSEPLEECCILQSKPSIGEAGPRPEVELPVNTLREKIFQAFNYLDTRWDPSQWLGLGAILFRLTDGSDEGQRLFEYWSYHYHPDYDDSKGVSPLWEWFTKGGHAGASMRTIRCFMAAGFALEELLPGILAGEEDEEVDSDLPTEELA
jgi:hypothetical protein